MNYALTIEIQFYLGLKFFIAPWNDKDDKNAFGLL